MTKQRDESDAPLEETIGLFPSWQKLRDMDRATKLSLLRMLILTLVCVQAFSTRLFSVLRFESVIHEFDPYFNYRSTLHLVEEGFYNFWNWFDETAWYPLGRIVGGTIYPGLMVSAAAVYHVLNFFHFTVNVRNVCVFLAPLFSANSALAAYLLTKEVWSKSAGLLAAAAVAIVPGYISRSVAGSYDNEGVAIFALLFTYYLWIKAVKSGSLLWSAACALSYFYMVSAWGGYVFIINLIPLHVLALLVTGRFSQRVYVAFCTVYTLGTIMSMQITFVGFQAVQSSEHMAALGTFLLLQAYCAVDWVRSLLDEATFDRFVRLAALSAVAVATVAGTVATATGYVSPWTGRFYSLLDPTYAKDHIPIIASVSEHQPTAWSSYFFDLHALTILMPVGIYFCFQRLSDVNIFILLYAVTSVYFSGVMVRLMLVLAPIACTLGGIAMSELLLPWCRIVGLYFAAESTSAAKKGLASSVAKSRGKRGSKSSSSVASSSVAAAADATSNLDVAGVLAIGIVFALAFGLIFFSWHATWVTSEAYSSPSIVLAARGHGGHQIIFDDFREAYYWLRQNTREDARVMSWWDYGYQLAAMANRTVIVDNNTWNNTHIATVGKAMASNETVAYEVMRELDVDYVLVLFGGLAGFSSDDINKFLWMERISRFLRGPDAQESDYYSSAGAYTIGADASPTMLDSFMYKMCYHDFGQMYTDGNQPPGYDRARGTEIGRKDFELEYVEEAFTTVHWLVRIYRVLPLDNRS
jgi:dolichyl-diphosphooligosaccharide---protein glycosyltransferase